MIASMILIVITMLILILGVLCMARGGTLNKKYGNRLMSLRVGFQALAILCIGIIYYLKTHGS
jgi:hypothetical protein